MLILKIIVIAIVILIALTALVIAGCYQIGKEMHYYRTYGHGRSDF